MAMVSVTVAT